MTEADIETESIEYKDKIDIETERDIKTKIDKKKTETDI